MIKVISISGRTNSDKQEVLRALYDLLGIRAVIVRSDTTRSQRPGDIPNLRNHCTFDVFQRVKRRDPYLWTVHHDGADFGTSAIEFERVFNRTYAIGLMNVMPDVVLELNRVVREKTDDPESHAAVYILSTQDEEMTRNRRISGNRIGLVGIDRRPQTAIEEAHWYTLAAWNARIVPTIFVRNNVSPERTAEVILRRLGIEPRT